MPFILLHFMLRFNKKHISLGYYIMGIKIDHVVYIKNSITANIICDFLFSIKFILKLNGLTKSCIVW